MSFDIPKLCPECNTKLKITNTGIDLYCPNNQKCPAQIIGRMSYYCQRNLANISGMSDKTISRLITEFGINDIGDLYDLDFEKISHLEGFGIKSANNLQESIESSKSIKDYKFLAGLGIDGIGIETAKLICEIIE